MSQDVHCTALSKWLNPPVVVVPKADSLVGARVSPDRLDHLLHNAVTKNSAAVLSPPLTLFALLSAATLLLLLVLFWRHNQSAYKRRYSQLERSFLPSLCTLTERE